MRLSRRGGPALAATVLALCSWGAGRANADLVLTPAASSQGFQLSTFATGFPVDYTVDPKGIGPLGIISTPSGGVLVADYPGNVRLFPTGADNQVAGNAPVGQTYAFQNAVGLTRFQNTYYMTQQASGSVVQVNANGTFQKTVVSGLGLATGILANPANGQLFVSTTGGPLYLVDPVKQTATVLSNLSLDGLALSADGTRLYAAVDGGALDDHIVGLDPATGKIVYDSGHLNADVDGVALGTGTLDGNLFVNTNDGQFLELGLSPGGLETVLATGGSRGDFVTSMPDGSLLLTQSDRVLRLSAPSGGGFTGQRPADPMPEPSTLALLGLSTAGLMAWRWRRARRA